MSSPQNNTHLNIQQTTTTALPPRKRARTDAEKEQRRVERIIRNRKAAHASREKKRKHVEQLESYVKSLEDKISKLSSANKNLLNNQSILLSFMAEKNINYESLDLNLDIEESEAVFTTVEKPEGLVLSDSTTSETPEKMDQIEDESEQDFKKQFSFNPISPSSTLSDVSNPTTPKDDLLFKPSIVASDNLNLVMTENNDEGILSDSSSSSSNMDLNTYLEPSSFMSVNINDQFDGFDLKPLVVNDDSNQMDINIISNTNNYTLDDGTLNSFDHHGLFNSVHSAAMYSYLLGY